MKKSYFHFSTLLEHVGTLANAQLIKQPTIKLYKKNQNY